MQVNREKLLEILTSVQPGLADVEMLEQSRSFVFVNDRVYTYNDEIAISHPCKMNFEGAVQGKLLFRLLTKTKDETLVLGVKENEVRVKGKRMNAGIALEAEIQLPVEELGEPSEWIYLPELFCTALDFCRFSVGHSLNQPVLNCIHVEGSKVTSCDNYRLTRYDLGEAAEKAFPQPLLIPEKVARQLVGYDPVKYGTTEGWLHFLNEAGSQFSVRAVAGKYIDTSSLLEVEGSEFEFPAVMSEILERAGIFSEGEKGLPTSDDVVVVIGDQKMIVEGKGPLGWFSEEKRVRYSGDPLKFAINPKLLIQILKLLRKVIVGDKMMIIEGEFFKHVIVLHAGEEKAE